jgi:AraC-like DNA-binding protein
MWVSFNGAAFKYICKEIHLSISSPVIFGCATIEMINLFENIVNDLETNEFKLALKATGHFLLLIDNLIKSSKENDIIISKNIKDDVVKKALEYIEINYYHHIDVDLLCQHVNYSRSYFSRLFKKEVGITIPEYINKVRVQRAKFLLKNTDLNINEVAKSVGYDDPFYFSRIFKRVTDNSPMRYKAKHLALEQINVQLLRKGK